jgi:quercetin dioxygenase-like cupin family protein
MECVVAVFRLFADEAGATHLEDLNLFDRPWENGPGDFKGVGGAVLGDATRVMLMRFESGARPPLHRAVPCFAMLLSGALVVSSSDGTNVVLAPGDAVRVETTGVGGWRLGNRGEVEALLAVVQVGVV